MPATRPGDFFISEHDISEELVLDFNQFVN